MQANLSQIDIFIQVLQQQDGGLLQACIKQPLRSSMGHSNDWFCLCRYWRTRSALNVCHLNLTLLEDCDVLNVKMLQLCPRLSHTLTASMRSLSWCTGRIAPRATLGRSESLTKTINRRFQYWTSYTAYSAQGEISDCLHFSYLISTTFEKLRTLDLDTPKASQPLISAVSFHLLALLRARVYGVNNVTFSLGS